jgi:hypothetical protein
MTESGFPDSHTVMPRSGDAPLLVRVDGNVGDTANNLTTFAASVSLWVIYVHNVAHLNRVCVARRVNYVEAIDCTTDCFQVGA